jgi:hypothetical protein
VWGLYSSLFLRAPKAWDVDIKALNNYQHGISFQTLNGRNVQKCTSSKNAAEKKKKTFSKLFDSSLLRDVNITLKNMSTMSAIKPSKICASVRGSHSLGHGRKALFLSPKKSALNFRESQFQGSTRALKARLSFSDSKVTRRNTVVRAEKVVGIDLGTTNSAVR